MSRISGAKRKREGSPSAAAFEPDEAAGVRDRLAKKKRKGPGGAAVASNDDVQAGALAAVRHVLRRRNGACGLVKLVAKASKRIGGDADDARAAVLQAVRLPLGSPCWAACQVYALLAAAGHALGLVRCLPRSHLLLPRMLSVLREGRDQQNHLVAALAAHFAQKLTACSGHRWPTGPCKLNASK